MRSDPELSSGVVKRMILRITDSTCFVQSGLRTVCSQRACCTQHTAQQMSNGGIVPQKIGTRVSYGVRGCQGLLTYHASEAMRAEEPSTATAAIEGSGRDVDSIF